MATPMTFAVVLRLFFADQPARDVGYKERAFDSNQAARKAIEKVKQEVSNIDLINVMRAINLS